MVKKVSKDRWDTKSHAWKIGNILALEVKEEGDVTCIWEHLCSKHPCDKD